MCHKTQISSWLQSIDVWPCWCCHLKQQQIGFLHNMGLAINLKNIKIMRFQNRPSSRDHKYSFKLGNKSLEHTQNYPCINISNTTKNVNKAVAVVRDMAQRALCSKTETLIRIWLKIIKPVIDPIALYESEIWDLLTIQKSANWDEVETTILLLWSRQNSP